MVSMDEMLARASWVSGEPFAYGPDDTGYYEDHRNHVVTRRFTVPQVTAPVELAIAVLGLAQVTLNGRPVGTSEVLGHWTNFTRCVYVDVIDVSDVVVPGENVIEIELGNGFYNPAPITLFGKYNLRTRLAEVGTPQVAAVLACNGEPIVQTDKTWFVREGELLFNNVYLGEVRDLRPYDAAERPVRVGGAAGERTLEPAVTPFMRATQKVAPRDMHEVSDGIFVDFGEMIAGVVDITFGAPADARVELLYAEVADGDRVRFEPNVAGLVGLETPGGVCPGGPGAPTPAIQRDVVITRAGSNHYRSVFTYHSFRYVLITGLSLAAIQRIDAWYVHTDLACAGSIETGDVDFDRLMDAALRTKLNNVHDVWEDCSRERFGYGGDMVSLMNSNLMLLDEECLVDRTLGDFARDQTECGGLPETAPFMGIGSNGPAYGEGPLLWQLAFPYLAVQADRYYGRRDLIERSWDGLARFGEYLLSFDPEELSTHCLGDHGSILTGGAEGFKSGTPDKPLLGWCAILWSFRMIAEAGARIGRDVTRFATAADELRAQIIERFAHGDGTFGDGTQSACAFAGMLGLGDPEHQAELLAADFEARDGVLTTGIFGTMLAFDLLNRTGHNDVVERWLIRREQPSLLAMLDTGSGALAEQFVEDLSSYDHAMFSSYAQWFMQALGGIRVADDAVACDRVVITPYFSSRTNRVCCSYQTPQGMVRVQWERADGTITVHVAVPEGVSADLSALEGANGVTVERC